MMSLPEYTQNSQQERIGVHEVGLTLERLGLIFRETSNSDVGIDGWIEYVNDRRQATGKIVATQIKSGESYLHGSVEDNDNWTFYIKEKHKCYWASYPIPIVIFVFNPTANGSSIEVASRK